MYIKFNRKPFKSYCWYYKRSVLLERLVKIFKLRSSKIIFINIVYYRVWSEGNKYI